MNAADCIQVARRLVRPEHQDNEVSEEELLVQHEHDARDQHGALGERRHEASCESVPEVGKPRGLSFFSVVV